MAWTKAKTAIIAGIGALLVTGTASVAVKEYQEHRTYPWQTMSFYFSDVVNKYPGQVKIVPTKFPAYRGSWASETAGGYRSLGIAVPIGQLILNAFNVPPSRSSLPFNFPGDKYDYLASLSKGSPEALQALIASKFHLSLHFENMETNVFFLRTKPSGPIGLKSPRPETENGTGSEITDGRFSMRDTSMDSLAMSLENSALGHPVLNQTHLDGQYDFDLTWDPSNPDSLNQALSDQLGLELVPGRDAVKILIVEPAKH